jgi:superfamily II DNA or RNA helicase
LVNFALTYATIDYNLVQVNNKIKGKFYLMQLRPYQQQLFDAIMNAWLLGIKFLLAVAPTGAGKTVLFSHVIKHHVGYSCAIAHRQELVAQISLALAREGVTHRIVAPTKVIKACRKMHIKELGRSFVNDSAPAAVAGVDTLLSRAHKLKDWAQQVTLWIQDEAHHVLKENKWGKAAALFPNAKGLGVTATPLRADGAGLGEHHDGVFQHMILGPTMGDLIRATYGRPYLSPYVVYCPESDIDLSDVPIGKTGDYSQPKLIKAARRSHIVGDVVDQYLKIAPGKQGITFVTDVETAHEVAARYNAAGVPAAALSAKTDGTVRDNMIERFRNGDLMQLVNVDLFGEGFDVPAVEVVSMARPTQSFSLFMQQLGRALRLFEGKERGILIDHVGNYVRFASTMGLPEDFANWTLDRREKSSRAAIDPDKLPLKACTQCTQPYEAIHKACPWCGHVDVPAVRSGPKYVEGDLTMLTPEILARLRGERVDMAASPSTIYHRAINAGQGTGIAAGRAKAIENNQREQQALRDSIAYWAGYWQAMGADDSQSYRRFNHVFGMDVMSAQALKASDAKKLNEQVQNELRRLGV